MNERSVQLTEKPKRRGHHGNRGKKRSAETRARLKAAAQRRRRPFPEVFWSKVNKDAPGGCWSWTGCLRHGHGTVWLPEGWGKRVDYSHRVVFRLLGIEIPEGLEVDHVCRHRPCCNPAHLRFVPKGVNSKENNLNPWARNSRKTHCGSCHAPLAGENLALVPQERPEGLRFFRQCLACYPRLWRFALVPRKPPPNARPHKWKLPTIHDLQRAREVDAHK